MTTRFRQKVTFIVSLIFLMIALLIAIFVWLVMSTYVFHSQSNISKYRINVNNVSVNQSMKTGNGTTQRVLPTFLADKKLHDPNQPPDIFDLDLLERAGITDFEYVRPKKVHTQSLHTDDLLYESKNLDAGFSNSEAHHITGQFRNKTSLIWDPHPQYKIDAFGMNMNLILYHDGSFIHSDLKVTHAWANETLRKKDDHKDHDKIQGCFYRGHVLGDEKSSVAVSLCDGMTGHIRTHQGTFMIEPTEKYTQEHMNILHIIYRLPSKSHNGDYHDDILHHRGNGNNSSNSSNEIQHKDFNHLDHNYADASLTWNDSAAAFGKTQGGPGLRVDSDIVDNQVFDRENANENSFHKRKKRSTHNGLSNNNDYTMEILVAVDKKMQEYHGDEIKNYILTLMSIVSSIFADASIGNSINIAVVDIIYLKHELVPDSKRIGVSASKMLTDFCRFKKRYNFNHDTALLLTRELICRNPNETKCDTLGLAELGTMCREESCSIVQDNGLSAAFTIAHELGHILNMPHDDDMKCNQFYGNREKEHFIMSRMLGKNTHPWAWSHCSRHFVTEYLENNHGQCMLNTPKYSLSVPTSADSKLAGEKFDQHQQCELVFGAGSKICSYMPECSALWCVTPGETDKEGCRSQAMPWADGTSCGGPGSGNWCQKAKCVRQDRNALRKIDGGWGPWSAFTDCSLPCGGGVQSSQRHCNSPAPENGGKYCIGNRVQYKSCNTQSCPSSMQDIRGQQCRHHDSNNFELSGLDQNVKWVPKYGVSANDECKLYCRVQNTTVYFLLQNKVKDGTPCNQDGFNKCVNGVCHQAGCDNVLYSKAVLDKCAVCNGNNDTCMDIHRSVTREEFKRLVNNRSSNYYYQIVTIPEGALNIEIRQPGYADDSDYLALKGEHGSNLVNGENSVTFYPKKFAYGGVIFQYNGGNQSVELITSTYATKLTKKLVVEILTVRSAHQHLRSDQDVIISYSYTIAIPPGQQNPYAANSYPSVITPQSQYQQHHHYHQNHQQNHYHSNRNTKTIYQWKMSEWSECDKLCYGKRFRTAACVQIDASFKVSHSYCHDKPKPADEFEECNIECDLSWSLQKSECSAMCGEGVRTLTHVCLQKYYKTDRSNIVDDSFCPEIKNKVVNESCRGPCPEAIWIYLAWNMCSEKCGGGMQNRTAECYSQLGGFQIDSSYCQRLPKEETIRDCNIESCPEWAYGEDTPCSVTCGEGKRSTVILCKQNDLGVNPSLCVNIPRPMTKVTSCTMPPCAAKKIPSVQVLSMDDDPKIRNKDVYSYYPPSQSNPNAPSIISLGNKYEWKTGRWGNCSTCGSLGKRVRSVRCSYTAGGYEPRIVDDYYCDMNFRPVNITNCADSPCPYWNMGEWTKCTDSCEVQRQVICQDNRDQVSDSMCSASPKPPDKKSCCHIKWRSVWTPCSVTCGVGTRTRKKVCMKLLPKSASNPHPVKTGKHLDPRYCAHLREPVFRVVQRSCKKHCDFRWEASTWSKCSAGCGTGFARREVTCTNGVVTSDTECDPSKKPKKIKTCEDRSHCVWKSKKWKSCKCDGILKTRIVCMDGLRNTRSNLCNDKERPPNKRSCIPPPNCSCMDLKRNYHIQRDGEYELNVNGKNVSFYCHNMWTHSPKEYLTLKAGDAENYAMYMSNRSKELSQCPHDNSDTFLDTTIPYGTTRFNKVRIKIHMDYVQIVPDDFEFSRTSGRKNQSFGTAGDCFSTTGHCPQGVFQINLEGTGLRINPRTEWIADGRHSSIRFHTPLAPPYLKVIARCGGYCGTCYSRGRLHLDVL